MKKEQNVTSKLLIIGTIPNSAGVGGVTVHVERLLQFLDKKGLSYDFFDYKIEPIYGIINQIRRADVIHLHICNPYYMFVVSFLCWLFKKKLISTLHGKYVKGVQRPWWIIKQSIKMAEIPIVLNTESFDTCHAINPHTITIPAFIPPQKEYELNNEIKRIVEVIHSKGEKVVVSYGGGIIYDTYKKEVYGIEFLINFFVRKKGYSLIISDPTGEYKKKYADSFENIYFIDCPHPLYELIKIADIFVRNTSKDGDSLSVKEALYLDKTVLCTNVVERPIGARLYKYSDSESFEACLEDKRLIKSWNVNSGEDQLLLLYKKMLKSVKL